jgi:tetratricopeptide (TPR) repeat protein
MSRSPSFPRLKTLGEVERLYAAAMADYAHGRYLPAAKTLLGLILVDASQARFFKGMAACMQLSGRYQQAVMGYASAYSLEPADATLLFYLAQCFAKVEGWREAGEAAQTFLDETADSERYGDLRGQALAMVRTANAKMNLKEYMS